MEASDFIYSVLPLLMFLPLEDPENLWLQGFQ